MLDDLFNSGIMPKWILYFPVTKHSLRKVNSISEANVSDHRYLGSSIYLYYTHTRTIYYVLYYRYTLCYTFIHAYILYQTSYNSSVWYTIWYTTIVIVQFKTFSSQTLAYTILIFLLLITKRSDLHPYYFAHGYVFTWFCRLYLKIIP